MKVTKILKTISIASSVAVSTLIMSNIPPAMAHEVKVFWTVKLNGRDVDRCIHSFLYPDGCSQKATEFAATKFCEREGYRSALSWSWRDTDYSRPVYKLLQEPENIIWKPMDGGFVFTGIACER